MKKHKHRTPQWRASQTNELVESLRYRAEERCSGLGHVLSFWTTAKKKKHGVGAQQAICTKCGEMVFISPYMEYSRANPQVPAIKGEILFQLCYKQGQLV